MGGGRRGQSHQVGYGSMNIGSYERELAYKSGRGGELNKAGTRQWGAMEPVPKRHRNGYAPHQQYNQNHHGQQQQQQQYRPVFHQQPHSNAYDSRRSNGYHNGNQDRRWQPPTNAPNNYQGYNRQSGPPPNNQGVRWQPPHPSRSIPPPQQQPGQRFHPNQLQQPRRGHNFQNFQQQSSSNNRGGHSYSRHGQYNQQQQQQQRSGLSSNVMNSLRSQLASTLNRNRQKDSSGSQRK